MIEYSLRNEFLTNYSTPLLPSAAVSLGTKAEAKATEDYDALKAQADATIAECAAEPSRAGAARPHWKGAGRH